MSVRWMFCGRPLHVHESGPALLRGTRSTSAPLATSPALYHFLKQCRQFRTLQEHLSATYRHREDGAAVADECRRLLPELERRGLVWAEDTLRRRLTLETLPPAAPVRTVVMPSAGRPANARRALEMLAAHAAAAGRSPTVLLCDDSRTPEDARAYQDMAASVRAAAGLAVVPLGPETKARLRPLLARRAGLDPALVDFALGDPMRSGFTCGANRNWCLLACTGLPLLSLDDDVLLPPRHEPGTAAGVLVTGNESPLRQRMIDPPPEAAPPSSWDLFAAIERWLGRPVHLLPEEAAAFDSLTESNILELAEGATRIMAVFHGFHGRPLVNSTRPWMQLDATALDRLHAPTALEAFLADPWLEKAPDRTTLNRSASFLGHCMALDNTQPLAPFFPAFHAEDAVMGTVCNAALPGAWTALLPATVGHLPPHWQPRGASGQMTPSWAEECFLLTRHWVKSAAPALQPWDRAEERLARLGRCLAELGTWAPPAFAEACTAAALTQTSAAVQHMDKLRASLPPDHALRTAITAHMAHHETLCQQQAAAVPSDLARAFGADAWLAYQRILAEFGRLLEAWPALWQAAHTLRAEAGLEGPGLPEPTQ
jgi:hypothetical protein